MLNMSNTSARFVLQCLAVLEDGIQHGTNSGLLYTSEIEALVLRFIGKRTVGGRGEDGLIEERVSRRRWG